jgi:hypothetical protein
VNRYSLTHVSDPDLLRELRALIAQDRATTTGMLAHLAEVDARRLYAPAGHPSMFAWCVEELHLSEEAACRRIRAARTARQFPAVYGLLAEGRLHLTAVVLLAPYLTQENADELFAAATHQSKAGIEELLAERFPRPDLPASVEVFAPLPTKNSPSPVTVDMASGDSPAPGPVGPPARPKVEPLAPGRYGLQFTVAQDTYDKLRYAQALLGHSVPPGELAQVLDRALDALIARLEQRKFAATGRPRPRRASASARHVPAEVRRAVWERDGGRCTFVSAAGHRCTARTQLEFDHIEPVARGGRPTVKGIRLRCRAHNQYAAECAFGADFMSHKREAARRAAGAVPGRAAPAEEAQAHAAATTAEAQALAAAAERARARAAAAAEVVPWLRALGLRADEARLAATRCEAIPDAPLEERVRCALSGLARPSRRCSAPPPRPAP